MSSTTHPQVQAHSSEQHGATTTTTATATGAAAGRNPQVQDITTTVHRRIQHLRGMEIQDDSILGTARPSIQQTVETVRAISRTSYKRPTGERSSFTTHRRAWDTTEHWILLVSRRDGPASTIRRQSTQGNGFETWRLIQRARYSIPLGTRSIGYLTRLLKPQLDEQKFEESFTTWEFQLSKYEQDNNTLPDAVKIAVLLNETKRPLQQHLQLQAGNITTYAQIRSNKQQSRSGTDGHRSNMVQQRQRKEGQPQGRRKVQQGKGYGSYGNNNNYKGVKGKYNQQPVGQGNPFKGQQGYGTEKGYNHKGKGKGYYNNQQGGKGAKGKHATNVCYRCGQPGHMAKLCRVAIYNCDTGNFDTNDQTDDWHSQAHYDNNWYH